MAPPHQSTWGWLYQLYDGDTSAGRRLSPSAPPLNRFACATMGSCEVRRAAGRCRLSSPSRSLGGPKACYAYRTSRNNMHVCHMAPNHTPTHVPGVALAIRPLHGLAVTVLCGRQWTHIKGKAAVVVGGHHYMQLHGVARFVLGCEQRGARGAYVARHTDGERPGEARLGTAAPCMRCSVRLHSLHIVSCVVSTAHTLHWPRLHELLGLVGLVAAHAVLAVGPAHRAILSNSPVAARVEAVRPCGGGAMSRSWLGRAMLLLGLVGGNTAHLHVLHGCSHKARTELYRLQ